MVKITATSDLHGSFPVVPECDILVIAGDVCPVDESHEVAHQRAWLRNTFFPWMDEQPAKHIVWIGGNHDFACEQPGFHRVADEGPDRSIYLQDSLTVCEGISIYGSPWVPNLERWAFYKPDMKFLDMSETLGPADIYLFHGPPMGILDALNPAAEVTHHHHVGSPYIERAIIKHEIPQYICGHIHESYGLVDRGPTRYRNVAFMNAIYEPVNFPHVFYMEPRQKWKSTESTS